MATVNVHEAKTHLSSLLQRASRGEQIIIARAGRPIAMLGPIAPASKERKPGLLKGHLRVASDFDAPLPQALLEAFYAGGIAPG